MASSRNRQRKLAREKYQRQMARRAQKQRRRRQIQAGIGVFVTLALVGVGSAWLLGAFEPEPEEFVSDTCTWLPQDTAANPDRTDVGTPDPNPPTEGVRDLTVALDAGDAGSGEVVAVLDLAQAPCAGASLEYLASQGYYNDTTCHEIFEGAALRCGDPSGTGLGGPAYAYYGENLPTVPVDPTPNPTTTPEADATGSPATSVLYPRGTVAVGDSTGQHGSQFLVFFEDYTTESPLYSIVGTVTDGLDLLAEIGKAGGASDPEEGAEDAEAPTTGPPAQEVRITSLTVIDPDAASSTPSATPGATPSAAPSATPSDDAGNQS